MDPKQNGPKKGEPVGTGRTDWFERSRTDSPKTVSDGSGHRLKVDVEGWPTEA
ncbi:MAG: hypothetical protein AAGG01_08550 [Planctomycetota bacterium]